MTKEVTYKQQGNGTDSWIVKEFDENNILTNAYVTFTNPANDGKVDLISIIANATPEEIEFIKTALQ